MNTLSLNRNQIKYIAIVAMLIDHIAWAFVPTASTMAQVMHFVGRFTGPTMAFFLYEGYIYTSDKRKYGLRLLTFAIVSQIPFASFEYGQWCYGPAMNVIWTLFLSFLGLCFLDFTQNKWPKGRVLAPIVLFFLCILSMISDWFVFDILWPAFLFIFKDNRKKQLISFWIIASASILILLFYGNFSENLFEFGIFVPCIVLSFLYNGNTGRKSKFNKWAFYVFYPLHLLIIAIIKIYFV